MILFNGSPWTCGTPVHYLPRIIYAYAYLFQGSAACVYLSVTNATHRLTKVSKVSVNHGVVKKRIALDPSSRPCSLLRVNSTKSLLHQLNAIVFYSYSVGFVIFFTVFCTFVQMLVQSQSKSVFVVRRLYDADEL